MKTLRAQGGITLVMSLIMLLVLTLLVVSAIRFGNINLKISGNAQTEVEAAAAAQVAVEAMVKQVLAAPKIDAINGIAEQVVSTGGTTYKVKVDKPVCVFTRNVLTTELEPTNPADKDCFENPDIDGPVGEDGKPLPKPPACKSQLWDVAASVDDGITGAKVNLLQGVALRVPGAIQCP